MAFVIILVTLIWFQVTEAATPLISFYPLPTNYLARYVPELSFENGDQILGSKWKMSGWTCYSNQKNVQLVASASSSSAEFGNTWTASSLNQSAVNWRVEVFFSFSSASLSATSQSTGMGLFIANVNNYIPKTTDYGLMNQASSTSVEPFDGFLAFANPNGKKLVLSIGNNLSKLSPWAGNVATSTQCALDPNSMQTTQLVVQSVNDMVSIVMASSYNYSNPTAACISNANIGGLAAKISTGNMVLGAFGLNVASTAYNTVELAVVRCFELSAVTTTTTTSVATKTSASTTSMLSTSTAFPVTSESSVIGTTSGTTTASALQTTNPGLMTSTAISSNGPLTTAISTSIASTTMSIVQTTTAIPMTSTVIPGNGPITTATNSTLRPIAPNASTTTAGGSTSNSATTLTASELAVTATFPGDPPKITNSMPQITFSDIMTCQSLQPKVRSPLTVDGQATPVYLTFALERFNEIEDVGESVSVFATLFVQWKVLTCSADLFSLKSNDRVAVVSLDEIWRPAIIFESSIDDVALSSNLITSRLEISYDPTPVNRTLTFYMLYRGIFHSKCGLQLALFPFDSQKCNFVFSIQQPNNFVNFEALRIVEQWVDSPNTEWQIGTTSSALGTTNQTGFSNDVLSSAIFSLNFSRRPIYYVYNLVAPCVFLVVINLGGFLLPPNEKSPFFLMILLSLTVAQASVVQTVPKTSQRILLINYILMLMGFTTGCLIYALITRHLSESFHKRSIKFGNCHYCTPAGLLDAFGFLLSSAFLLCINIYAMKILQVF